MKRNKLIAAFLMMVLLLGTMMNVSAADRVITFDGSTKKFDVGANTGDTFQNLLPGDSRQIEVQLVNNDATEMKFYLDSAVAKNLAAAATGGVMDFRVDVAVAGEALTTLLSAVLADGKAETTLSAGVEAMTVDNKLLLATLKKGEQATVYLNLHVDGSSTENMYMRTTGQVDIGITAETIDDHTLIKRVSNVIRTGDTASLALIGIVGISLLLVIVLIVMKRKKKEEGVR